MPSLSFLSSPNSVGKFEGPVFSIPVFPNPVEDLATINWGSEKNNFSSIKVFNACGIEVGVHSEITTSSNGNKTISMDTHELPTGMYIVLLQSSSTCYTTRFIILK